MIAGPALTFYLPSSLASPLTLWQKPTLQLFVGINNPLRQDEIVGLTCKMINSLYHFYVFFFLGWFIKIEYHNIRPV